MFVRVWEYAVPASQVDAFVAAYGPDGDWATLFRRTPGYLGTDLYRDVTREGWFLTVDRFTDEQAWHDFLAGWSEPYREIDERLAHLTTEDRAVLEGGR